MNHLIKTSIFALGLILSSNAFAATGAGHAQTELSAPLRVQTIQNINFGTIAIDPSSGPQNIPMNIDLMSVDCPSAYVCSGTVQPGRHRFYGQGWANLSVAGSTATLSDGTGNTIIFDPVFYSGAESKNIALDSASVGFYIDTIMGSIQLNGDEPAGTYNTSNAGGSGYVINVIYN